MILGVIKCPIEDNSALFHYYQKNNAWNETEKRRKGGGSFAATDHLL